MHRGIATGEPEEIMRRHVRITGGIVFLAIWVVAAAPEPGLKSALDTIKADGDPRSHQGPRPRMSSRAGGRERRVKKRRSPI